MIKVKAVYIDICDNFRYYLRLNNKRLDNCNLKKHYLYFKYLVLKKINYVSKITKRRKHFLIIYSDNEEKIQKKSANILKNKNNVIFSNYLLKIIENFQRKSEILKICVDINKSKKVNFFKNIEKVLIYTMKMKNIAIEQCKIYLLLKKYQYVCENHIINISKICNSVNIITPNIQEFSKLEKKIEKDIGGNITVSNNKRKSVAKAKYIINIDFNEKEINKYNLGRNAFLFNLSQNKISKIKGFDGYIINNVEFKEKDNSLTRMIDRRFGEIYDENFEIVNLIGNNGKIEALQ